MRATPGAAAGGGVGMCVWSQHAVLGIEPKDSGTQGIVCFTALAASLTPLIGFFLLKFLP